MSLSIRHLNNLNSKLTPSPLSRLECNHAASMLSNNTKVKRNNTNVILRYSMSLYPMSIFDEKLHPEISRVLIQPSDSMPLSL
ncbi:unnamed protein product [Trichobilharzia szidati]|nr:unnamed protein product [Trichobilharzia szidati]